MGPEDRTPSDVIWRLVEGQRVPRTDPPAHLTGWSTAASEGLRSGGTTVPNGLKLRGRHGRNGVVLAEVRGGRIVVGDTEFESPSAAATAAARELGSQSSAVNGWLWWQFESPVGSNEWHLLDDLRHSWDVQRRRTRRRRLMPI